jgi:starch phosphorylase
MNIKNINLYNVSLKMPKELTFLDTLKENIWWCWQHDAVELISSLDAVLWAHSSNNMKLFVNRLSQEKLESIAKDKKFLGKLALIEKSFKVAVADKNVNSPEDIANRKLAYFSLEYGIHESLRLYSGGLGVLSGDHLKAASDLTVPMVAVGLLYKQGYFVQQLDKDGWQNERYPENDLQNMPITPAKDANGNDVRVKVRLLDREITIAAWVLNVGNIPLILLDTNLQENPEDLRGITSTLYGGDKRMRLHQELVLAVGGYRAIRAMGYPAESCHLNEGHAAFLSFARIGDLVDRGIELNAAVEIVWSSNVFTTHTPVPAGNEVFDLALLQPYLEALQGDFKLDTQRMISWGIAPNSESNELSMTILGLRMSYYSNGVSRLHGEVAREMWAFLWDGLPEAELPITSITNGVHIDSWLSPENKAILNDQLSEGWHVLGPAGKLDDEINAIPDETLWNAREKCRARLIQHARTRLKKQLKQRNASNSAVNLVKQILDPNALTIGFARRFATYKRATLFLRDKERLLKILKNEERPVQIIFAGKAHPADNGGKSLIQEIIAFANNHDVRNRLVFIEDYDIELGRFLTQGVDVWLNNPLRPQEASGTSGMKAAANGALNCSILDGWWEEGYEINDQSGWAIRNENETLSQDDIDTFEANALYTLIEEEIAPTFYNRNDREIPANWVKMMKASMSMSLYNFSSARQVDDYDKMFYKPALANYARLFDNHQEIAKDMVVQKHSYAKHKQDIHISQPTIKESKDQMYIGDAFEVETEVYLADLTPEEVKVEVYYGQVDSNNNVVDGKSEEMNLVEKLSNGNYSFKHKVKCDTSGRFGLTARITSAAEEWSHRIPTFIKWAE